MIWYSHFLFNRKFFILFFPFCRCGTHYETFLPNIFFSLLSTKNEIFLILSSYISMKREHKLVEMGLGEVLKEELHSFGIPERKTAVLTFSFNVHGISPDTQNSSVLQLSTNRLV